MINYTLPDFTANLGLNLFFIRLLDQHPELFQDKVRIDSVYGCFPGCVLNGGRAYLRERSTPAQMEQAFSLLEEHGVKARLTLTNMLATKEQLRDTYVNAMLEVASRHGAEAIVYADAVGDYVRDRYGMRCVLSTTRPLADVGELNRMTKRYDYVVLDYNCHKDPAFLGAIEDKGKVEVMVNEFCTKGCPHRQEHYLHNSQDQHDGTLRPFACVATRPDFFGHQQDHPVIFTDDEVRALHDEQGIEYFKIVGRGVPFETTLESLAYYLLKPAYRENIKQQVRNLVQK